MLKNLIGATWLAALLTSLATCPSQATVIDATHSIFADFDLSPATGPFYLASGDVSGTINQYGSFPGNPLDPYLAEAKVEFYSSNNILVGSSFFSAFSLGGNAFNSGYMASFDSSDPTGHVIISSVNGSLFDVTTFNISLWEVGNWNLPSSWINIGEASMTQIAAVPEPSIWALLLLGLAVVGGLAYQAKFENARCDAAFHGKADATNG